MTPRVSVVIPTCRRPRLLARCLDAVLAQDLPAHQYEIIVVDDGASAGADTERVVTERRARSNSGPSLRYLATEGFRGPAAARNIGWGAARTDIVAFTDDDCVPWPSWLRSGIAAFEAGVAGVSGRLVVPLAARPTDYERNAANLQDAEFATANCFYRRSALAEAGGFDQRFRAAWREDSDLFFTLCERDAHLKHAPDAVVVHPVRPAQWGVSLGQQRKSVYNALLYKKHPRLYRERIQAAPPWHYYAIIASLVGLLVGVMTGERRSATAALALWFMLSARFCTQRLRNTSRAPSHMAEMIATSLLIPSLSVFYRLRGALKYRVWFL